ncbi:ABC transporter permease [Psychrobacillus sp. NPDC096389]|uniref:ABC transporter permease n=1 Tax=Psychrobacillus sp. NPDC096389 TaxID=3364490 RepID=UPI003808D2DC
MKTLANLRLLISGLTIFFIIIPIVVTIPASFTSADYPSFPPKGFSFQWYMKLLDRPEFISSFSYSVQFAILTAIISVVLGTISGLALAKYDLPGKSYLVSFLMSPLTVPQLVLGVALLIFFTPMMLAGTPIGLLIAHVIISVPFVMRYVLTGLSGFDYTLERAAMILGANPFQVFWKVTVPLIRPAIFSGGLFAFLTSFDNVTVSLFMISSDMRTLPIEIFSHMQDSFDPLVASASSVVILISVLLILLLDRIHGVGRLFGGPS